MDPVRALELIAFRLERAGEPTYRVRAFRHAAQVVAGLSAEELSTHVRDGTLTQLAGIGKATAGVVADAMLGREPRYLARLADLPDRPGPAITGGQRLRAALRGDCHTHSDWSDGGSPMRVMAEAARELGRVS